MSVGEVSLTVVEYPIVTVSIKVKTTLLTIILIEVSLPTKRELGEKEDIV
jgi:hypothetical protein